MCYVCSVIQTLTYNDDDLYLILLNTMYDVCDVSCYRCCCCLHFVVSGGMYNIIRGTQWEGRNEYISGDSHDQYGIESIIIGVINISLAFSMVIAVLRAFITIELDHPQDETSTSTLKKILGTLFLPFQFIINYFLIPVCIVAVAYIWCQLVVIYTRKNWSYHYGWVIGKCIASVVVRVCMYICCVECEMYVEILITLLYNEMHTPYVSCM